MDDRGFDILKEPQFKKSNQVFDGVLKKLKQEGQLHPIKHKEPIYAGDMTKITGLFLQKQKPKYPTLTSVILHHSSFWSIQSGSAEQDVEMRLDYLPR